MNPTMSKHDHSRCRAVWAACALVAAATWLAPTQARAADAYRFDAARGQQLFTANCAACHQLSGAGIAGVFPPLKGNSAVNADDPTTHLHTILFGAHGVVIDGKTYTSPMSPFASQLSDAEIADIANHERSAWGNHGKPVTAAQVTALRAKGK